ncbi:hypothetical protein D5R81_05575 [Parashewanella spongiae]|uniref:Protein kinase domain-containing protein n=1 Tax=Parashewanella spongiae TaxID=342950 RepID=A0A3A6U8Z1_9GAMM|nr:hypothetical protein [Parashewanella spongiae]MCL1077449.1 hypothetical protein [Parashewanella spongiae]RJY18411.1 hypothetical protein D5R81_05575 [Parashewanella spongiae]
MAVALNPQQSTSSLQEAQYTQQTVNTLAQDESSKSYAVDCPYGVQATVVAAALRIIDFHSSFSSQLIPSNCFFLDVTSECSAEDNFSVQCALTLTCQESSKCSQYDTAVVNFFKLPTPNQVPAAKSTNKLSTSAHTKVESAKEAQTQLIAPPFHAFYSKTTKGKQHLEHMSAKLKTLTDHPFLIHPAIHHLRAIGNPAPSVLLNTPPQFQFLSLLVLQNYNMSNLTETAKHYVEGNMSDFSEIRPNQLSDDEMLMVIEKLIEGFLELKRRGFSCHNITFHDLSFDLHSMQPYINNMECVCPASDTNPDVPSPLGAHPHEMTSSTETLCPSQSKALETQEQQSVRQLGEIFLLLTGHVPKYIGEIIDGQTGLKPTKEYNWHKMKADAVQAQAEFSVTSNKGNKLKKVFSSTTGKIQQKNYSSKQPFKVNLFKFLELLLRGTPEKRPGFGDLLDHITSLKEKRTAYKTGKK